MRRPSKPASVAVAPVAVPTRLLLALAVALLLLLAPATGAHDATAAHADEVLLAVDADDLGPEPQPREADGNAARELAGYEDQELMFTWAASILLLGLVVTLLVIGGGLWYLLVVRPNRQAADAR